MRRDEIEVGGIYVVRVSGKLSRVRVDEIRPVTKRSTRSISYSGEAKYTDSVVYDCTNLDTNRKCGPYRSAAKFRKRLPSVDAPAIAPPFRKKTAPGNIGRLPPIPEYEIVELDFVEEPVEEVIDVPVDSDFFSTDAFQPPLVEEGVEMIEVDEAPAIEFDIVEEEESSPVGKSIGPSLADVLKSKLGQIATALGFPHLAVRARAGCGKTFTLIVGVIRSLRNQIPGLWEELVKRIGREPKPLPQQQAVWAEMEKDAHRWNDIQFTAFSKKIVNQFEQQWGWVTTILKKHGINFRFSTMHSLGFAACRQAFPVLQGNRNALNEFRVVDLIAEHFGMDVWHLRREKQALTSAVEELVGLVKKNLIGLSYTSHEEVDWDNELQKLSSYYDIELEGVCWAEIVELVPKIWLRCLDVNKDGQVDYNDMEWLPVALNLPVRKFDLLLVDEAQDMNQARQALVLRAGRRIVICGDDKQAIFGFTGADPESFDRTVSMLGEDGSGCLPPFPLSVTMRCGKAIVREANSEVPDLVAHPDNPEGEINRAQYITKRSGSYWTGKTEDIPYEKTYLPLLQDGDLVLCRVNAPLVTNCFKLLRRGIRANILGRDVAAGLISTITKAMPDEYDRGRPGSAEELVKKVSEYTTKKIEAINRSKHPSENKIINLYDRQDCINCFATADGVNTANDVISKINSIFTDDVKARGILFATVHAAKGMEADRVFILFPEGAGIPHPMAKSGWQMKQETNLLYVAKTRAKEFLCYVS